MTPARGIVLVRPIETPERIAHSRIILTDKTREVLTTHQMEVVSVGEPVICADEECERPHLPSIVVEHRHGKRHRLRVHSAKIHPGDWVLVKHRCLSETHQEGLYCAHQDDIIAVLQVVTK